MSFTSRAYRYFQNKKKPQLSDLMVLPSGAFRESFSNIKVHENGIITRTLRTYPYDELPISYKKASFARCGMNLFETGWGNGYVSIPENHPFLALIPRESSILELSTWYVIDTTYQNADNVLDLPGNCWTYSNFGAIEGFEGNFMTFGFDTAHYNQNLTNWPESRILSVLENIVHIINNTNG